MAIEEGQIDEFLGCEARGCEMERVGGGGGRRAKKFRVWPRSTEERGSGIVADGDPRRWGQGAEVRRSGENFLNGRVKAQKDLVAMGIDGRR